MVKRLSAVDQNSNPLTNVPTPSAGTDAANKSYVDDGTATLTNKTLTTPIVTTLTIKDTTDATKVGVVSAASIATATTRTYTLPDSSGTLVLTGNTGTFTNKTINLTSNTLVTTLAQLNSAISDADVVSTATISSNGVGYVNHGATASTARPTGFASIIWRGTVAPTNATAEDTWIDVS